MSIIDWWKQNGVWPSGRVRWLILLGLATLVAAAAGYAAGVSRERARHAATAEVLVGTVIMSNEGSRWILFYPDGVIDPPNDADWIYHVIADGWEDASGTIHGDETYPTCLVGDESGVSMDRGRVELTTIDWDHGGRQPMHVAVRVRCLD